MPSVSRFTSRRMLLSSSRDAMASSPEPQLSQRSRVS